MMFIALADSIQTDHLNEINMALSEAISQTTKERSRLLRVKVAKVSSGSPHRYGMIAE